MNDRVTSNTIRFFLISGGPFRATQVHNLFRPAGRGVINTSLGKKDAQDGIKKDKKDSRR